MREPGTIKEDGKELFWAHLVRAAAVFGTVMIHASAPAVIAWGADLLFRLVGRKYL